MFTSRIFGFIPFILLLTSCGNVAQHNATDDKAKTFYGKDNSFYEGIGIGPIKSVKLSDTLNEEWVEKGKTIYEQKCISCHKLTSETLIGPGWQGITLRRKPEWIMNMAINPDEMVSSDLMAQQLMEEYKTKMLNQHLNETDARMVLEFMRNNDRGLAPPTK